MTVNQTVIGLIGPLQQVEYCKVMLLRNEGGTNVKSLENTIHRQCQCRQCITNDSQYKRWTNP